jgi:hypothetical protein
MFVMFVMVLTLSLKDTNYIHIYSLNFSLYMLFKLCPSSMPRMTDGAWVAGHLTGGLGNRLFQHAAAAGYAERYNKKLVFSLEKSGSQQHGPIENIFKLFPDIPIHIEDEHPIMLPEQHGAVFTYVPLPEIKDNTPVCIDGWRQTDKYFPSDGIKANLDGCVKPTRQEELRKEYAVTPKTWFVHLRLGDYKILPHHQINMAAYYKPAMEKVPTDAHILVFCDEASTYNEMLIAFFQALGRTVTIVKLEDELETLWLMSQCWGGAVVANSTFSWWGAYFARQRCPTPSLYVAYYPTVWGQGLPEARDIIPSWGTPIPNPL